MTLRQLSALTVAAVISAYAQKPLSLNDGEAHGDPPFMLEDGWKPLLNGKDLSAWTGQDGKPHQWFTTASVRWERLLSPNRLIGLPAPSGTILNSAQGRTANLVTLEKFGDTEMYLEFMLAKGSNSGVYLHGLYEIQIFDSFGSTEAMRTSDGGAIYHRWIDEKAVGGSARGDRY